MCERERGKSEILLNKLRDNNAVDYVRRGAEWRGGIKNRQTITTLITVTI